MKSFPEKPAGKLKPNESTIAPWKDITTDFVTGLPEAQGYDALFVTCCHHTRGMLKRVVMGLYNPTIGTVDSGIPVQIVGL